MIRKFGGLDFAKFYSMLSNGRPDFDNVLLVWSNMALIISGSGTSFIVRLATILLARFLSSYVNLDNARVSIFYF